jgi:hypothetical protein
MEEVLTGILTRVQQQPASLWWEKFQRECASYHSRPATTLAELASRDDKKRHGDLWELFCVRYLLHHRRVRAAWILKDVPAAVRATLSLGTADMGIDIVAVDEMGGYWAVQCKWRSPQTRSYISWAQLSTFYALAARTGPYAKHLVLTNASGVRHVGAKQPEDETVACAVFKKMPRDSWMRMVPQQLPPTPALQSKRAGLGIEELREARIRALDTKNLGDKKCSGGAGSYSQSFM